MILSKKYRKQLNKIVMTEDMKKRILHNVLKEDIKVKTSVIKKNSTFIKKIKIIAACFTVILCLNIVSGKPQLFKYNNLSQYGIDDANKEVQNIKVSGLYDNNRGISKNDELKGPEIKNQYSSQDENYKKNESSKPDEDNNIDNSSDEKNQISEDNNANNHNNNVNRNNQNNNNGSDDSNVEKHDSDETKNKSSEKNNEKENNEKEEIGKPPILTAGEWKKEYKTLEEAEETIKFKIDYIKGISSEFVIDKISVIENNMIEIEYNNGQYIVIFRAGKVAENISGDYNTYKVQNIYEINKISVKLQGNENKIVNLATWKKGDISYSISSKNGIAEEVALNMVRISLYSE